MSARVKLVTDSVTFARLSGVRDAVTTSESDKPPTCSVRFCVSGCDKPASATTWSANPSRRARNASGTPAGTSRRKAPSAPVVTRAIERPATTASTTAPDTTAPEESAITP